MTDRDFSTIWADAQAAADPEAFASDWVTSSAFIDPEEPEQEIDTGLFRQLQTLWGVAHWPFRELLQRMELSQTGCAQRFCIPLRTVQDWAAEKRTPPAYVRLMMAEAVGLINRKLERSVKMYYFINDGVDPSEVYGSESPVCIDREEMLRLCSEWGDEFRELMHVASAAEIEEYGVYDS